MKIFKLLTLLTIICCFGCSDNQPKEMSSECPYIDSTSEADFRVAYMNRIHSNPPYQKYFGIGINHELMEVQSDAWYTDDRGNKFSFITITTVISNDTTLPLHLKIDLPKEHAYPTPNNERKFKLFMVPINESLQKQIDRSHLSEESKKLLTPASSSITLSNGLIEEKKKFIDTYVPFTLNQTIDPNEKYVIKIGILVGLETLNLGQFALISKGHMYPFFSHYCDISKTVSANKPSNLFLALDFFTTRQAAPNSFEVIPCGQISFSTE